jgi:hypothetical protein
MRTPWGFDCPYFFGDYYRGRKREECRLITPPAKLADWSPEYCKKCPVPAILMANACPNMVLKAEIHKGFLKLNQSMKIDAYCTLSEKHVDQPEIGCGRCHPLPDVFLENKQ